MGCTLIDLLDGREMTLQRSARKTQDMIKRDA
ncbi:hypothetical protein MITS9508_02305 [Synechococcus sp. MIT S9508]|nr:hypothetical protein MITS9508_02305 [Synechococcus sp. MIT S9508]